MTTQLPGRFVDHTTDIQDAVSCLGDNGGGTLFFPCTTPPDDPFVAIYNIKSTIYVPPNVTLQGESAEEAGKCRIYWNDVDAFPPELPGATRAQLLFMMRRCSRSSVEYQEYDSGTCGFCPELPGRIVTRAPTGHKLPTRIPPRSK